MNSGMIQQNTETKFFKREQTLALNRQTQQEHLCALPKATEECHGILRYALRLAQMVRLIVDFFVCLCAIWLIVGGGAGQQVLFILANPVDCCFLEGLYCDQASGIVEGACGPLLIHADKAKTKEKEAQEHLRQCNGETTERNTAACWTQELENLPDVLVETTGSGSMMQEVFLVYAKHFVSCLPTDHQPVILFLDGHGSRWNVDALLYLMANHVFPFILPSHTSIWSQPNDAGVNKRFHSAVEQICEQTRRTLEVATVPYFNKNFADGWQKFLQKERDDLRLVGVNNATNAFRRTGLFPYNPFCEAWSDAIDTVGRAEINDAGAHYEIFPNKNASTLSETESKQLREGFASNGLTHDMAVAYIRGTQSLSRWRQEIEEAVREGENYNIYSHTLLPLPKTESEKLAMKLVHFRKIESSSLCVQMVPLTREEKAAEVTRRLVYSSKKMEPISVTYLSTSESESGAENSDSDTASKAGTAVKVDGNKWRVVFNNDISMTATDEDLLDPNKFYVERAWMRVDNDDMSKRKQAAKQKRVHQGEQKEQEKRIIEKGLEKLCDAEFSEYNKMREKFESGQGFKFEEFLELLEQMRKPFVAQIEGHEVLLTQDDCAIMMESSVLRAITETLFVGKEKCCKNSNCNSQEQNK